MAISINMHVPALDIIRCSRSGHFNMQACSTKRKSCRQHILGQHTWRAKICTSIPVNLTHLHHIGGPDVIVQECLRGYCARWFSYKIAVLPRYWGWQQIEGLPILRIGLGYCNRPKNFKLWILAIAITTLMHGKLSSRTKHVDVTHSTNIILPIKVYNTYAIAIINNTNITYSSNCKYLIVILLLVLLHIS